MHMHRLHVFINKQKNSVLNLKLKISGFNVGHVHLDKKLLNFSFQKKSEGVCKTLYLFDGDWVHI
jgi:hypothetical protein